MYWGKCVCRSLGTSVKHWQDLTWKTGNGLWNGIRSVLDILCGHGGMDCFCGVRLYDSMLHCHNFLLFPQDEVGMIVRLTFEAMVGDKAMSCLELINDGTTVIHYKWKRVPEPKHCVKSPSTAWMQRFYFSTNSGLHWLSPVMIQICTYPWRFWLPGVGAVVFCILFLLYLHWQCLKRHCREKSYLSSPWWISF